MKSVEDTAVVASEEFIKDKIYTILGQRAMLDVDLAKIYGYTTKTFNQQVKNNIQKFDEDFQLTKDEVKTLRSNIDLKVGHYYQLISHTFTGQDI